MGLRRRGKGLQARVSGKTTVRGDRTVPYPTGQKVKRSFIRRSGRYVGQVRYSQSLVQSPERLLLKNISCPEEKREMAASHKFKTVEPVSEKATFQNVHSSRRDSGSRRRGLADFSGSEGCLFPHSHTSSTLEIPEILCGRQNVRIQSLALRDYYSPSHMYQDASAGGRAYKEGDRVVHVSIPGRLLGEGQGKVILGLQIQGVGPIYAEGGTVGQLGEVRSDSISGHGTHRVAFDDRPGNGGGSRRSYIGNNQDSQLGPRGVGGVSGAVPQAIGLPEQCDSPGGVGEAVCAADPALPSVLLETQYGSFGRHGSSVEFSQETPRMVAGQTELGKRVTVVFCGPEPRTSHRRQHGGLGGLPLTGRGDQGCMVSSGEEAPYKLLRDVSSIQGSDIFSPDVGLGGCDPGQERQHDCRDIYKQAGGYKVIHPLFPDLGDAQLVPGSAAEDASSVRSGGKERVSGPILEERPSSRVVLVPNSGGGSLPIVGTTPGGPICESAEQQATAVLLPGGGSERDVSRCVDDGLERAGVLCLSASAAHTKGTAEGKKLGDQNDSDHPKLGEKAMDVHPGRSSHRHTSNSTREGKASKDARTVGISSRSSATKFSCLEDRRRRLRQKGFRREAAKLATGDIRNSTESCYNGRVRVFINWCNKNGVKDPIDSSLASVCNFLHEIFQEGKAAKTVGGYIAALSKWHRRIHGKRLCDIEEVANIRKATVIARPPRKISFQSWSLPLVLDSLIHEPYEPMIGCQLKFLCHKTAFLVAVSTARRSSELGALSVDESKFLIRPRGIEVGYVPGFVPKNARINYAGKTIVIPKFEDMASCEEEVMMCPVRAVKCYRRRMDLLRKEGEKRLFVTYGSGDKQGEGASKRTLARWITETIKFAYSNASEEIRRLMNIKAHSVRAAATTYAILKGVEVRHILEAADWATPTTFIDYYFRPGSGPGQEFASSVLKAAKD